MKRRVFALGAAATLGCAAPAAATGGLDVWDPVIATPPPIPILPGNVRLPLRVLIGTAGGSPRQLDPTSFALDGKVYRGTASVVALGDGRNGVVTTVSVDDYLYGVVPLEVSPAWPPEALAAQAIMARTYAVARRSLARPYDLVAGSADQVYGGRAVEAAATSAAVDATSGQIVTYSGAAASVFYMACCGGHTEDAAELWGRDTLPYLRGVADPWCAGTPDYRWRETIGIAQFLGAVPEADDLGGVLSLAATDLDPSGRPRTVVLRGSSRSIAIPVTDLRRDLGATVLPSTFIRQIDVDPQTGIVIEGAGRGHGVGMCQWGARTMALQGRSAAEIVQFYFPGTTIARA